MLELPVNFMVFLLCALVMGLLIAPETAANIPEMVYTRIRSSGQFRPEKRAARLFVPILSLIHIYGASLEALRPMVDRLTDVALELGAQDVLLADTDERKESIWNARGAFLEAIKGSTPNMDECDVVVPRDRIAAFVKHSVSIGREEGVRICSFGHAGDGNLHLYICQDGLKDAVWTDVVERVMERLYAQARELGGCLLYTSRCV